MLQLIKGRRTDASIRLSANGRSLLVQTSRWLGKGSQQVREIPLESICDYEYSQNQKLVLYYFDKANTVAEWKRLKKLKAIDTAGMDGTTRQLLLAKIKEMVRINQQLGVRKQHWYYMSMPVSLEFG